MRGSLQFLISIIYTVVIVMMIYVIFQAFVGASAPRESPAQIDTIGRAFSAEGSTTVALQGDESIFIGYATGECRDQMHVLTGGVTACQPDAVCLCYLFDDSERTFRVCQEKLSTQALTFSGKSDGTDAENCIVADTAGLYRFTFDSAASKILLYMTAGD